MAKNEVPWQFSDCARPGIGSPRFARDDKWKDRDDEHSSLRGVPRRANSAAVPAQAMDHRASLAMKNGKIAMTDIRHCEVCRDVRIQRLCLPRQWITVLRSR